MPKVGQKTGIKEETGQKLIRLKNSSWVRKLATDKIGVDPWSQLRIGMILKFNRPNVDTNCFASSSTWYFADSAPLWWSGLCPGPTSTLAQHAVEETIGGWAGWRSIVSGSSSIALTKASAVNTLDPYIRASIQGSIFENGLRKGTTTGSAFDITCAYWQGVIWAIDKSGSTFTVNRIFCSPLTRDCEWPEVIDIMNHNSSILTTQTYATGTYGWFAAPYTYANTIDEATYGTMEYIEVGCAGSALCLDLDGVIVRGY